jgi:hypothetical protein
MGFWDKFGAGDRFKFNNPGDSIEGEILNLSATTFGGTADPTPVLLIRTTAGDREVTASQAVLCSKLAENSPEVGDRVKITYDGEDPRGARPGRNPAKLFTVIVKRATAPPATPEIAAGGTPEDVEPF